jgi:hypothetical protein
MCGCSRGPKAHIWGVEGVAQRRCINGGQRKWGSLRVSSFVSFYRRARLGWGAYALASNLIQPCSQLASVVHWICYHSAWRRGTWRLRSVEHRELECLTWEVARHKSSTVVVTRRGNDVVSLSLPACTAQGVHGSDGQRVSTPFMEGRGERRGKLWCPRFLISIISANDRINRVKHVDVGQTLVNLDQHLENLSTITNDLLNRANTHFWSNLGQRHSQTNVLEHPLELLSLSPNFI